MRVWLVKECLPGQHRWEDLTTDDVDSPQRCSVCRVRDDKPPSPLAGLDMDRAMSEAEIIAVRKEMERKRAVRAARKAADAKAVRDRRRCTCCPVHRK